MGLSNRVGQIWVLAVISVTMIAYQNCSQSMPEEATQNSQGTPTPTPTPVPLLFSTITGTSSTGHDRVFSVAQGGDLYGGSVAGANNCCAELSRVTAERLRPVQVPGLGFLFLESPARLLSRAGGSLSGSSAR